MYRVEMYARVRRACRVEGMSTREASRVFGLDRKTVRKMLSFSVPPGYRRGKPPRRPKLGPFTGIIDRILEGIVKLTDCRLFSALLHEAKPLKLRRGAFYNSCLSGCNPHPLYVGCAVIRQARVSEWKLMF